MNKADVEYLAAWGVYIWGTIYTAAVFLAGILTASDLAWKGALISAGFAYLAQYAVYLALVGKVRHRTSNALVLFSIVSGAVAGLSLLF